MSIDVLDLGDTRWIEATFYDSDEALADPTTVTLRIIKPSGAVAEEIYSGSPSAIENTDVGAYRRATVFDEVGDWFWQWAGTGTVQEVQSGQAVVVGNGFS